MMRESGRWVAVVVFTLALHFTWEMVQGGLFVPMQSMPFWPATRLCALATAGDLVITAIAFSAAAMAGGLHWPLIRRRRAPALLFLGLGILITIAYEIYALSAGKWAYAERMPVIFGIGLTPVLQWILLPMLEILAFRLIWRRTRKTRSGRAGTRTRSMRDSISGS